MSSHLDLTHLHFRHVLSKNKMWHRSSFLRCVVLEISLFFRISKST